MPLTPADLAALEAGLPRAVYLLSAGPDWPLTAVSETLAELVGLDEATWRADPAALRRRLPADDAARYLADLDRLGPGGESCVDYRVTTPDGRELCLRERRRALPGPDGRVDRVACWALDITEEKRAEAARLARLDLVQQAVDRMDTGFAVYDSAERITVCNRAFAALHGLTPDAMIGCSAAEIHRQAIAVSRRIDGQPMTDAEAWLDRLLGRMRATGQATEVELTDGRFVLITSQPTAGGGTLFLRTDITEQKQAEARIRKSEEQFRRIVEGQPLPVWLTDVDSGEIVYASPSAAALFGVSLPEAEGADVKSFWASLHDRQRFIDDLARLGEVTHWETTGRRADGSTFPIALTARMIDHDGRRRIVTALVDLTERRAREAAMREARETLEDAIGSLSEGFALYDADDRLIVTNARYREFNDRLGDVLVPGQSWEAILRAGVARGQYRLDPGIDPESWIADRLASRQAGAADVEIQHADGRWYKISRQRTRRGGIAVIRTDITPLKQLARQLSESEERFRSIADAHPVPVVIVGLEDHRIRHASPATEQLWGVPIADLIGRDIRDFYIDVAENVAGRTRFRETGALDFFEVRQRRADGTELPVAITSRPIHYDGVDCIVTGILDLSRQKATEAELQKQRDALNQAEKLNALGTLLAGISHELNNPLSVVVGQALMLQETADDPAIADRARRIGTAADRCARIVRTFLAMARQQPQERRRVALGDIVDATLELTAYMLKSTSVEVTVDLPDDLPAVVADRDQLGQVLVNLVINAQQAMLDAAGPRRLTIAGRRVEGKETDGGAAVRLSVEDTGAGIPPEIAKRIFEPFFTTKADGGGTGVGLAISRGIVEAHGGTILIERGAAGGARLVVLLPAAAAAAMPRAEGDAGLAGNCCRILAVDDEPEILDLLREVLVADGHAVETAESGRTALVRLAEATAPFDLVISDIRMPDLDGPALWRRLTADGGGPRIAFMTGDTLGQHARAFLEETGLPCLEKPFTPKEARALVRRLTDGPRAAAQ
ncbi:MAG: PAS domain S-box protein [Alphaproteobacteria bacterium]|jgi:PAS domain S-box-containing protein|nr:PAS domain S-box protein [Alphaproteobacteria bacterium]